MVTTGNGRQKIVIQDVLDVIWKMEEAAATHDFERVHSLEDELKDLVLKGIMVGDFQGLTAKVAARIAYNTGKDVASGEPRYTA